VKVATVAHGSPEYWQAVELRRHVLRLPLGLDFSDLELAGEVGNVHFAALSESIIVGTLMLVPQPEGGYWMKQVAVREDLRGSGIGRALVLSSETYARSVNQTVIFLHARVSAVPFYINVGYEPVGNLFVEVGIDHLKMIKNLGS
jgi:predicted GNAT family N-acyltransferase